MTGSSLATLGPRRLWDAGREIIRQGIRDRLTAEAARAAYYLFLSLFPLLLVLFALTGMYGGDRAFDWITGQLEAALPRQAAASLELFVEEVTGASRPGVLSFGILFTLWSASNVFVAITEGLNRVHDLDDTRPWWRRRVVALAAVVVATLSLVIGSVSVLAGPELLALLGAAQVWSWAAWPMAVVLLVALMWTVYLLLPDRPSAGAARPALVGAVVGTVLWIVGTAAFRFYVSSYGHYGETYGLVGGVIVLLLWLYLTAFAILFGGEVAATLQQRWTEGWEVGEPPPPGVP